MTFSKLKNHLKELPCGKRLNHSVYILEDSLAKVDDTLYKFVEELKGKGRSVTLWGRVYPAFLKLLTNTASYIPKNPGVVWHSPVSLCTYHSIDTDR
jgi:hypothetical protein